jgi:hypothetical protein
MNQYTSFPDEPAKFKSREDELENALRIMWHLWLWAAEQGDLDGDAISDEEGAAMDIAKAAYEANPFIPGM